MTEATLPHWDLSTVYKGLDQPDFTDDVARLQADLDGLEAYWDEQGIRRLERAPAPSAALRGTLETVINRYNELFKRAGTLGAFVQSIVTTDSYNQEAMRELSKLQMLSVRMSKLNVRATQWIGSMGEALPAMIGESETLKEHQFFLEDAVRDSEHMMPEELEGLATELVIDGATALGRLQGTVTSQLKVPFERDGKTEDLPITVVRNLCYDKDPAVRERAYHAEVAGWKSIESTIAACLNSVKGTAITLAKRRGWGEPINESLNQNRIDRATLDAMMGAIREHFPTFRRYLKKKAGRLGKDTMPWWDLFAPVGESRKTYSWEEARDLIVEKFSTLTPELGEFARNAFAKNWIDAEPRDGKRGGAFCMPIAGVEESRILANFDGSFEQVSTLAHELGHGYHNFNQTGLPMLRRGSPMCLAETASIFCETLTAEAIIKEASDSEKLSILETQLINATQVCLDISSRYLFEQAVFDKRAEAELSAQEFCDLMTGAQAETYGEGIVADTYHPYMWLWKPHYYSHGRNYYNYPYAFGHLFGLGLYAVYQQEGEGFVPRYKELLRSTGEDFAAPLAGRFGIDITKPDFWKGSLEIIKGQVERYEAL